MYLKFLLVRCISLCALKKPICVIFAEKNNKLLFIKTKIHTFTSVVSPKAQNNQTYRFNKVLYILFY